MIARDIMTAHPSVVTPDDTVLKAAQVMRDRNIGALFVIDNLQSRRLLGILTDRDIVVRCIAAGHAADCPVQAHMTSHHLTSVRVDDEVSVVAAKMKRDRVKRIPVMGEGDRLSGVVALADLAARLRPSDPELVEDIAQLTSAPVPYSP